MSLTSQLNFSPIKGPERRISNQKVLHLTRRLAPTLMVLTFAKVLHAQGTMDFSGTQTLMGTFKTHLQHVITAAAINLLRIASWADGTPLAKTVAPTSPLFYFTQLEFATSVNIAVTRGNLSDENCACRRQNLRFLESFRKIYSNRNRFCGQFLRHVFIASPWSQTLASCRWHWAD
jgi:hypothetical protein